MIISQIELFPREGASVHGVEVRSSSENVVKRNDTTSNHKSVIKSPICHICPRGWNVAMHDELMPIEHRGVAACIRKAGFTNTNSCYLITAPINTIASRIHAMVPKPVGKNSLHSLDKLLDSRVFFIDAKTRNAWNNVSIISQKRRRSSMHKQH